MNEKEKDKKKKQGEGGGVAKGGVRPFYCHITFVGPFDVISSF